jgi:hypothetical protein
MKKSMIDFSSALHNADTEKRRVIYYAVAEPIVTKLMEGKELNGGNSVSNIRLDIKSAVDYVGELAIIDRTTFEKIMVNTFNFKANKPSIDDLRSRSWDAKSFEDMINLEKYYSRADMDLINKEFELYRKALKETLKIVDELVADITGN